MSNSYAYFLQGLVSACIEECRLSYPSDLKDWGRDESRLLSLIEDRGSSVVTVDLPAICKHLDRSLAAGCLTRSGLPLSGTINTNTLIPKLFQGLWRRIFNLDGLLREDCDINAIFLLRQMLCIGKKIKMTCSDSVTYAAIEDFYRTDAKVRLPTTDWVEDVLEDVRDKVSLTDDVTTELPLLDVLPHPPRALLDTIQLVADIVSSTLGNFNPEEWLAKHGPGAVSDLKAGEFKYNFPTWSETLQKVFPMDSFAYANQSHWIDDLEQEGGPLLQVPYSKLIAVPKTQKTPRLIAAEPVAHQWCQQSIKDFLDRRSRHTPLSNCIHFQDQSYNGRAALSASRTGSHWTIDLSSASDRMSCWLVERIFRGNVNLLGALKASRTRFLLNLLDKKSPRLHQLRKFSTQGSACTFPIQTYVYSIVAMGCVLYERNCMATIASIRSIGSQVLVFGDDIIVPEDVGSTVVEVLSYLGFKVNDSKTFGTGRFRESCGVDAFDGVEVTPAYATDLPRRSRPESIASATACSNNFFMKGLWRVSDWLQRTTQSAWSQDLPIVPVGSGYYGWTSFCGLKESHLKTRWNSDLHRNECLQSMLYTHGGRVVQHVASSLLQFFTEAPRWDQNDLGDGALLSRGRPWECGVQKRPSLRLKRRWVPSLYPSLL